MVIGDGGFAWWCRAMKRILEAMKVTMESVKDRVELQKTMESVKVPMEAMQVTMESMKLTMEQQKKMLEDSHWHTQVRQTKEAVLQDANPSSPTWSEGLKTLPWMEPKQAGIWCSGSR